MRPKNLHAAHDHDSTRAYALEIHARISRDDVPSTEGFARSRAPTAAVILARGDVHRRARDRATIERRDTIFTRPNDDVDRDRRWSTGR